MNRQSKHPALIVAGHMLRNFRIPLLMYAAILTLVVWTLEYLRIIDILPMDDGIYGDIWNGASDSPKIFALVIGITAVPLTLASFISNGLTRRDYFRGQVLFMLTMALLSLIAIQLSFAAGHAVLTALEGASELARNPFQGEIMLESFMLFLIYFGSGMLIGLIFYRFDWRLGVLLAVLAYGAAILGELAFELDNPGEGWGRNFEAIPLSLPVQALLALLVWGIILLLNFYTIRRVVIKRKAV